jgi:hypothetical protein
MGGVTGSPAGPPGPIGTDVSCGWVADPGWLGPGGPSARCAPSRPGQSALHLTEDDVFWGMTLAATELLCFGVTFTREAYFFEDALAAPVLAV